MGIFCFNTSFVWTLCFHIYKNQIEFVNFNGLKIIFMPKKCNDLADCLYMYAYTRLTLSI